MASQTVLLDTEIIELFRVRTEQVALDHILLKDREL